MKPPAPLIGKYMTTDDILAYNRHLNPRSSPLDIRNILIRADAAPYGIPLLSRDCPFAVRGRLGEYLLLEDCIASQDSNGNVLAWTVFHDLNDQAYTIQWTSEVQYDDFPVRFACRSLTLQVRCPHNGRCVSSIQDCAILDTIFPICGGNGRCRADGTCECNRGHSTFLYNTAFSKGVAVPYDASNPALWGVFNTNWRDYGSKVCAARDCSILDCSPPKGCFPGSPSLSLADKHVICAGNINKGKCAITAAFCETNATAMLVCSGKGILRKHDDKDEYYCACGDPVSNIAQDPTTIAELVPNGFGGRDCSQYYCTTSTIYFSIQDPLTGKAYRDMHDLPLPGKWIGACGAPIGPSPDDISLWNICCPNEVRLERCPYTPCIIGGRSTCTLSHQCIERGGKPQVYPCTLL
jgi:hypothetical protein